MRIRAKGVKANTLGRRLVELGIKRALKSTEESFSPFLKVLHGLGDTLGRPQFACGHTSLMGNYPNL